MRNETIHNSNTIMLLRNGKVANLNTPLVAYQFAQKALRDSKCAKVEKCKEGVVIVSYTTIPIRFGVDTISDDDICRVFAQLVYAKYLEYQYKQHRHDQYQQLDVQVDCDTGAITISSAADQYEEQFAWEGEAATDAHIQAAIRAHCPNMEMSFHHPFNNS